jgi:hypothetical protein
MRTIGIKIHKRVRIDDVKDVIKFGFFVAVEISLGEVKFFDFRFIGLREQFVGLFAVNGFLFNAMWYCIEI